MTTKRLMIVGAFGGFVSAIMEITGHDASMIAFACGALFGKGYGIWEERAARAHMEKYHDR